MIPTPTTKEEFIEIHKELHTSLDKLVACYIASGGFKLPSQMTVFELMQWSHEQTKDPSCYGK